MPILMTAVVPGLDAATYDQIAGGVEPKMRSATGFRGHLAYDGDDGWTVLEVWDSEADWREFFEAHIKDHLPADATQEITELHNSLLP